MFFLASCDGDNQPPVPKLTFTIQHVFYVKPPVDRVILVGMVDEGSVSVGDELTVHCASGDVPVVVEGLEALDKDIQHAGAGQQIGLRVAGISKDEPVPGNLVTRE